MVATKRRFDPNLQRVRVNLGGKAQRAYVCTRCLKAGKVTKAQVREIAEKKMADLNCDSVESAMAMIEGSARSMGLEVKG